MHQTASRPIARSDNYDPIYNMAAPSNERVDIHGAKSILSIASQTSPMRIKKSIPGLISEVIIHPTNRRKRNEVKIHPILRKRCETEKKESIVIGHFKDGFDSGIRVVKKCCSRIKQTVLRTDKSLTHNTAKDHDCLNELPHLASCDTPTVKIPSNKDMNTDSSAHVEKAQSEVILPTPAAPFIDWNNYHRLSVIHQFIDEMEYEFPSICTSGIIGHSIEGRELKILKISNSNASNASVWMDAGIHGREWIAPAVATYIADNIARNFNSLPNSITNKDWYFLPVVNPDGYEHSHTVDRMWRKNRARVRGACCGVDLNRNFSIGWGMRGSSDNPSNAHYRGPHPFSEPESCAMRDMLSCSGVQFKIYLTLHSYGEAIVFPFAYRTALCPDYIKLLEGGTVMSKAIHESSGRIYKVGTSKDVMYGAAGTSNDFSYGACNIPFCYLIELRSKKHKFKLPKDEIELTCNEILNCVKALAEFVDSTSESGGKEAETDIYL